MGCVRGVFAFECAGVLKFPAVAHCGNARLVLVSGACARIVDVAGGADMHKLAAFGRLWRVLGVVRVDFGSRRRVLGAVKVRVDLDAPVLGESFGVVQVRVEFGRRMRVLGFVKVRVDFDAIKRLWFRSRSDQVLAGCLRFRSLPIKAR